MQQIKTASATVVVASVPSSAVRPWLSQPAASVHSIAPPVAMPVAPSVVAKVEASADGQAAARERREDAEERRRSGWPEAVGRFCEQALPDGQAAARERREDAER